MVEEQAGELWGFLCCVLLYPTLFFVTKLAFLYPERDPVLKSLFLSFIIVD
jgi:hypothetical protein